MCESNDKRVVNPIICQMFDNLVNKQNVFFKSQQKDETDLTVNQKRLIVKNLFYENKELFLQRYGSLLSEEELNYFDEFKDNNNIIIYLKSLKDIKSRNKSKSIVKNRRFVTLKQLIQSGDYFSDTQMQNRNPVLFEQMIGQYMSDEEKIKLTNDKYSQNHERITFSSFLLEQIDNNYIEDNIKSEDIEEFDSDDSDSDIDDNIPEDIIQTKKCLNESEKLKLREEFIKLMTEQFLSGKDSEFYDYNRCDNNIDLDFNEITERDIEDKYFNE